MLYARLDLGVEFDLSLSIKYDFFELFCYLVVVNPALILLDF
jgi:hypothetical protein